jgi:hypothetical protein
VGRSAAAALGGPRSRVLKVGRADLAAGRQTALRIRVIPRGTVVVRALPARRVKATCPDVSPGRRAAYTHAPAAGRLGRRLGETSGPGAWRAEGVEVKRAKDERSSVSSHKPRVGPWAQQAIPKDAVFSRVAADDPLSPTLQGRIELPDLGLPGAEGDTAQIWSLQGQGFHHQQTQRVPGVTRPGGMHQALEHAVTLAGSTHQRRQWCRLQVR